MSTLPDNAAIKNANVEELRRMIADYQQNMAAKDMQIIALEEEKQTISSDFATQLATVRDEFARMSEIAVREQEELNEKISDLEHELEAAKAKGESSAAGAALDQKKKIEAIQAESEQKLKKNEAKLEKMAKQLEEMKSSSGDQANELAEMTA